MILSGSITYTVFMILVGILTHLYCQKYHKDEEETIVFTIFGGFFWFITITIVIIFILAYVVEKYMMKNCLDKLFDFIHKILP